MASDDDDQGPQIKGVVIISLPPPDNPSLGKTITAFTLTDDDYPHREPTHQTHLPVQSPPPPPPPPLQNPQGPLFPPPRRFLGTPRKVLGFVCVCLFALFVYSHVFLRTLQESRGNNEEDRGPKSFLFPLYSKSGIGEIPQKDLQNKLRRFVYKENLEVSPVDGVIEPHQINKLGSSISASAAAAVNSAVDSTSIFPVRGNIYPDGLYFTYILVGSPPRPYYVDIDTASDLTWIQCDAPCTSCAKGANALYKPRRGNLVPSKDSLCMEVQRNQKVKYCETCLQCDYEIDYADASSSMGVLTKDELQLMVANGSLEKLHFAFGCGYDQQGLLLNTLVKTDGILGLSRAKVSLPSQLASQGIINNVVGHCLTIDVRGGGYMFLGDDFVPRWGMNWVPMLNGPSLEFYHTEILKLNYGSSPLSLGGQDGRVRKIVFDSGSSYTYFTREAYSGMVASLEEVSGMGLVRDTSDTTLPYCWRAKLPLRSVSDVKQFFKTLTLQLGSKWWIISKRFRIPPEGYLTISKKGNVCLGILDGSKLHDGSTIILGDISLRGQLIVYDNGNKKIGWAPSDCSKPKRMESLPFFDG